MKNPNYSPYVHFKSPLLYGWCMFIEFHPLINIFIQVNNHTSQTSPNHVSMPLQHFNNVFMVKC
jgi:hypothetical protein